MLEWMNKNCWNNEQILSFCELSQLRISKQTMKVNVEMMSRHKQEMSLRT